MILPDLHGGKAGLDDWLLVPGNDVEHGWPKLERLSLDHERFNALTAWWQGWQAKKTTRDAIERQDLHDLEITETAGSYTARSVSQNITIIFNRLSDVRGEGSAEITVTLGQTELLGETDIGLKSDSSRDKIARTLNGLASSVPWKRILERACTRVLKWHRQEEPITVLQPAKSAHVSFTVNPIVYQNHQTLLYAPGGSLKSYLALYLTLLACHGAAQHGIAALRCPVLYLDWELNAETVGGRLKALQAGHPELSQYAPYYRRCEASSI